MRRLGLLAALAAPWGLGSCGEHREPQTGESPPAEGSASVESPARDVTFTTSVSGLYELREYVDLSGRFSSISVRIFGQLAIETKPQRVTVILRTEPLLRGNEVFGTTRLRAEGTWRREGHELLVDGLDLANGRIDVFEPRGQTKHWRIEREGAALLIRAGALTFERRAWPLGPIDDRWVPR